MRGLVSWWEVIIIWVVTIALHLAGLSPYGLDRSCHAALVGCPVMLSEFKAGAVLQEDGQLTLTSKHAFRLGLKALRPGPVTIVVKAQEAKRTLDQNAFLHAAPFRILAEFFGESVEQTKYVLMGECFGWTRDAITQREIPVKPSTSSMTVEECTFFIDWLIPWAQDKFDITLPLPE